MLQEQGPVVLECPEQRRPTLVRVDVSEQVGSAHIRAHTSRKRLPKVLQVNTTSGGDDW